MLFRSPEEVEEKVSRYSSSGRYFHSLKQSKSHSGFRMCKGEDQLLAFFAFSLEPRQQRENKIPIGVVANQMSSMVLRKWTHIAAAQYINRTFDLVSGGLCFGRKASNRHNKMSHFRNTRTLCRLKQELVPRIIGMRINVTLVVNTAIEPHWRIQRNV